MVGTMTKKDSVIAYLSTGATLSSDEARHLFGVKNFRATMSDIREQVERFGNWRITRKVRNGETRYAMRCVSIYGPFDGVSTRRSRGNRKSK